MTYYGGQQHQYHHGHAAQPQGQNTWWSQPLPAGWEAKYDSNTQRYFYINHLEHKTTWVDPRQPKQQALQPSPQFRQPSPQPSPRLSRQPSPRRAAPESIPMQELKPSWQREADTSHVRVDEESLARLKKIFPSATDKAIRSSLIKNSNVEGLCVRDLTGAGYKKCEAPQTSVALMHIKREFPTADNAIIKDLLRGCDNNEEKVKRQLVELGYQPVRSSHHASRASTPTRSPTPATGAATHASQLSVRSGASPAHHDRSRQASPTPPAVTSQLTQHEKNRQKEWLQREFPTMPGTTLEMALDACQYDEEKTRTLLRSMESTSNIRKAAAQSHANSTGLTSTSTYSSQPTHTSQQTTSTTLTSASTAHDAAHSVAKTGTSTVSTVASTAPSTSTSSRAADTRVSTANSRARSSSPDPGHRRPQPKKTSPSKVKTKQATARRPAAAASTYKSENRCTPTGPNSTLASGANKALLISQYIHQAGPKHELIHGPQKCNLQGAGFRAHGPNRSLRCGPNPSLAQGSLHTKTTVITHV